MGRASQSSVPTIHYGKPCQVRVQSLSPSSLVYMAAVSHSSTGHSRETTLIYFYAESGVHIQLVRLANKDCASSVRNRTIRHTFRSDVVRADGANFISAIAMHGKATLYQYKTALRACVTCSSAFEASLSLHGVSPWLVSRELKLS